MSKFVEFQAVVLAGGLGNRMIELTNHIPKVLLPVANIPMIWYPLHMLSRNNITDVIVVTNEQCHSDIRRVLNDGSMPPLPNLNIELVHFPSEDLGTADVLRNIKDKLKHDVMIVSGDFVSDLSLTNMLKVHRGNNSFLTCLLTETALDGPTPGPKGPKLKTNSFVALAPGDDQLVFMEAEEDLESDSIELNENVFRKFPRLSLSSKFNDCHLYLLKNEVLDLLEDDDRMFSSIKADLIPYLLKRQYIEDGKRASRIVGQQQNDEFAWNRSGSNEIRCFAYRTTYDAVTLLAHCNTIGSYFEVNKQIKQALKNFSAKIPDGRLFDFKTTGISVTNSRISQERTKIEGEKIVIRNSNVAEGCEISSNVKITDSILMKGVKISRGVVIDKCIVMSNVEISENSRLVSCIVAPQQSIEPNSKLENLCIAEDENFDIEEDV